MTSLQGIQASSWSHVHVPPDVMLASVYLALCGIAYDTPPGDARCVCQFSIELCGPGAGLPCSSPTSGVPCSHGCSWAAAWALRSPPMKPYEALVSSTRSPGTIRMELGRKCWWDNDIMDWAPLLPQLMVIHPAAAQMPLSWPAGSLRHHRMAANYRYLASESYVPTHPTSPGWRGTLAGRYGPSNIVPILGLGARVRCPRVRALRSGPFWLRPCIW